MHPHLDLFDEIVRILGWPTLLGILVWAIRTWDKGQRQFTEISENTKTAVAGVTAVSAKVDVMQNNHLVHLQDGIIRLANSNDAAVEVLGEIKTGIAVLTDRFPRV